MDIVNEGTTAYLAVTFIDKDGAPAAPAAVSYRIDCLTSGEEVIDDTSVSPAAAVSITIAASANSIRAGRPRETRRVTITGSYGAGDAVTHQFDYQVRNLSGAP